MTAILRSAGYAQRIVSVLLLVQLPAAALADSRAITNISVSTNTTALVWEPFGSNYIVESRASLLTGGWAYVGWVAPATTGVLTNNGNEQAFYRIRKVQTIEFLDPNFDQAVRNGLPTKYSPTNQMYDIDVETVGALNVSAGGITSLTGIAAFSSLTNFTCDANHLTNLDVSVAPGLLDLRCSGSDLTHLSVSACTMLNRLHCYANDLTALDLSSCSNLVYLYCYNNALTNLDISGCTRLEQFFAFNNNLTELNLTTCSNLVSLYCYNNSLTNLDISGCSRLEKLYAYNNSLFALNASANPDLTHLRIYGNSLTNLNVSSFTNLVQLQCYSNDLSSLDVSACLKLSSLSCHQNSLTGTLSLAACTNLTEVNATSNSLSEIVVWDVGNLPPVFLYDIGVTLREP